MDLWEFYVEVVIQAAYAVYIQAVAMAVLGG